MGLLDFLGFGRREKPNLVSSVARPQAADLYNVKTLREIAKKRLTTGEGLGYGDDFTSRMSSPGIAQIDANFKERTVPTISSEASKRGLARSSIVTDQIGRADQARNRDITEQVAKFQYLNELQEKQDYGQALTLAQNLDQQEAGLLSDAAAEGERVRDLTVGQSNARNAAADKRQTATVGSLLSLVSPAGGSDFNSSVAATQIPTAGTVKTSTGSPKANLLGSLNSPDLDAMNIDELLALMGGG